MRRSLLLVGLLAGLLTVISQSVRSQPQPKRQATAATPQKPQEGAGARPAADRSADEAAIRANVAAFARAYDAKDSKALAALFTEDGQIVDKEGNASEGREAIAKTFADLFADSPKKRIEVT